MTRSYTLPLLALLAFVALFCACAEEYTAPPSNPTQSTDPRPETTTPEPTHCEPVHEASFEARRIPVWGLVTKNGAETYELFPWSSEMILIFRDVSHPAATYLIQTQRGRSPQHYEASLPPGVYDVSMTPAYWDAAPPLKRSYESLIAQNWTLAPSEESDVIQRADFNFNMRTVNLNLTLNGAPLPTDESGEAATRGTIEFLNEENNELWSYPVPLGAVRTFAVDLPADRSFQVSWVHKTHANPDTETSLPRTRVSLGTIPANRDNASIAHDIDLDLVTIDVNILIGGQFMDEVPEDGRRSAGARGAVVFTPDDPTQTPATYTVGTQGDSTVRALLPKGRYGLSFSLYQASVDDYERLEGIYQFIDCAVDTTPCTFQADTAWSFDLTGGEDSFNSPDSGPRFSVPVSGQVRFDNNTTPDLHGNVYFYDLNDPDLPPQHTWISDGFAISLPTGEYRVVFHGTTTPTDPSPTLGTAVLSSRLNIGPEGARGLVFDLSPKRIQTTVTVQGTTMPDGLLDDRTPRGQLVLIDQATGFEHSLDLSAQGPASVEFDLFGEGTYDIALRNYERWEGRTFVSDNPQGVLPSGRKHLGTLDMRTETDQNQYTFDVDIIDIELNITTDASIQESWQEDFRQDPIVHFEDKDGQIFWTEITPNSLQEPITTKLYPGTYRVDLGESIDYLPVHQEYTHSSYLGELCVGRAIQE